MRIEAGLDQLIRQRLMFEVDGNEGEILRNGYANPREPFQLTQLRLRLIDLEDARVRLGLATVGVGVVPRAKYDDLLDAFVQCRLRGVFGETAASSKVKGPVLSKWIVPCLFEKWLRVGPEYRHCEGILKNRSPVDRLMKSPVRS